MNNISTNIAPCDVCNLSHWGVTLDEQGILAPYCTYCSGEYAHTKEAREAAAKLTESE
jgi:hypothetical protein